MNNNLRNPYQTFRMAQSQWDIFLRTGCWTNSWSNRCKVRLSRVICWLMWQLATAIKLSWLIVLLSQFDPP